MKESASSVKESASSSTKPMVILDLGKRKRKQIKSLRKGEGSLMQRINDTVAQLQAEESIEANSQVVVVVVKEKPKSNRWF